MINLTELQTALLTEIRRRIRTVRNCGGANQQHFDHMRARMRLLPRSHIKRLSHAQVRSTLDEYAWNLAMLAFAPGGVEIFGTKLVAHKRKDVDV